MESLRHPNVVLFYGACVKYPNLGIVMEYCENKSLDILLANKSIDLPWDERKRIALEIATGMNYLHCFKPKPIIHRDLKSLNILIDECLRAKIGDFGWTRLKAEKMTKMIGSHQWMAPEVITGEQYSEKADIFSYGIILWEIAAREKPYKSNLTRHHGHSGVHPGRSEGAPTGCSASNAGAFLSADEQVLEHESQSQTVFQGYHTRAQQHEVPEVKRNVSLIYLAIPNSIASEFR